MVSQNLPQGAIPGTISLLLGHPDPATLFTPEFRGAIQSMLDDPQAYAALQYGPGPGTPSLIEFLIEKINREQELALGPDNIMLVAGSTGAVDMLARLYARPEGVVLVEAPTYADALHIFRDHQIELCAIPMDEDGLIVPELEKRLAQLALRGKSPDFLYTIPNFHNPTGSTIIEARRREIIALARRHDFLIVEDDVYHDLAFEGVVPPSFYKLAQGQQVCSIGSFSKTLAPGLRLGWLAGAEEHIQRCLECGTLQMGGGANPFAARVVAEYCRGGHWEPHIARLRSLYKTRCAITLAALERTMPSGVRWTHPAGGFFTWLSLPESISAQEVKRQALHEGVTVATGEGFFVDPVDGAHNLRLAYSCATPGDIEKAIQILAQVILTR